MTPEQTAHEKLIADTAASLGRAMDHAVRCKLQAELYRQIGERDETVRDDLEAARLARILR